MGISRAPLARKSVAPDLPPASDAALTAFDDGLSPALVGRNCKLQAYSKYKVPTFEIQSNFTAYASPDSTFDLTRMFVDSARKSILVGIYDTVQPPEIRAGLARFHLLLANDHERRSGWKIDILQRTPVGVDVPN